MYCDCAEYPSYPTFVKILVKRTWNIRGKTLPPAQYSL